MKEQIHPQGCSRREIVRTLASLLFILALLSGCTAGAPSLDSSAQAWVEYPYEGSTLPMGQIIIVIYAADPGGISYIHIKINGESLPAYAASPMTTDGSSRLVRIDYAWPPAGTLPAEGAYVVEAVGVNSAGASSAPGSTRFCIVTCVPIPNIVDPPTDTPTPAPGPTDTPIPFITLPPLSPTPTLTFTSPPPQPDVTVSFFADPPYVNAGNCYTLHWDVTGTDKVYLNGSFVYFRGMEQKCPCETETHTLRVVGPDGTSQNYYTRVDVYGSCYIPPTTEVPPVDTSGPTINSASTFWEGCSIYGQAGIYDPSGVSYAEFWYRLNNGGWISIPMSDYGGSWQSQYGIETGGFAGSVRFKIRAVDTYNNESWSGVSTYNFSYCGG